MIKFKNGSEVKKIEVESGNRGSRHKQGFMTIGTLQSLIHCPKCDMPIEIYSSYKEVKCPVCKKNIDLVVKMWE